jgi:hypothetical protein
MPIDTSHLWGRLPTCGGLSIRLPGLGAALRVRPRTRRRIGNPPQIPNLPYRSTRTGQAAAVRAG